MIPIKGYATRSITNSDIKLDKKQRVYTHKPPTIKIEVKKLKGAEHPTQKPVSLAELIVKSYTREGDLVLDSFMGSGTIGVACAKTFRDYIGIEINKEYFNIAEKRINDRIS